MNRVETPSAADRDRVRALLGREPRCEYAIVVRDHDGDPVVLRNAPLLDDGTPMPTRYWLIGPQEHRRIGQLESAGGVNAAESAINPGVLAAAHERYAAERDRELPTDYTGPVPTGGVGGTRVGVKCLHAHWAWYLAGGDDPVGAWIATQLDPIPSRVPDDITEPANSIAIDQTTTKITIDGQPEAVIGWGSVNLTERWLADTDPPAPADLTNALGTIDDELDDIVRTHATWRPSTDLTFVGPGVDALMALELGHGDLPRDLTLSRPTIEELFRLTATASTRARADNPGLPQAHVSDIVAVCCIVLAVMRRFQLTQARFAAGPTSCAMKGRS